MTHLLQKAFEAASQLPTNDQDAIAAIVLEELSSERQGDIAFAGSARQLEKLAEEALEEQRELLRPGESHRGDAEAPRKE